MRRQATAEQKAAAEERRKRFRGLVKQVAAMTEDQQAEFASRVTGIVTVEGRALSFHNTILIASQYPTATIVGGFRQWKSQGRSVRKGEHGAMIWIPKFPSKDDGREAGEVSDKDLELRFLIGTVFDVSQTEETSQPAQAA